MASLLWTATASVIGNIGTNYTKIWDDLYSQIVGGCIIENVLVTSHGAAHAGGTIQVGVTVANPETDSAETWLVLSATKAAGTQFTYGQLVADRGSRLLYNSNWASSLVRQSDSSDIYLKVKVTVGNVSSGSVRIAFFGRKAVWGYSP